METKKSVVTAVAENIKQWVGQNGTVYYHTITFENGDTGTYGSKTAKCEKFVVGAETDYTKETKVVGQYTNVIIKTVQSQQGGFKAEPRNQKAIIAQSSYERAVAIRSGLAFDLEATDKIAEHIFNWVCQKGGVV